VANAVVLSDAEFTALLAVDGSRAKSRMSREIESRLRDLKLIERREWPNGPLWRSARGDRQVREGG